MLLAALVLIPSWPGTPQGGNPSGDSADVEAAVREFLDVVHAFDYEAMRDSATSDFEILIFGRRMDMDAFEELLREMEARREGRPMRGYELEDLNTEIVGDVAYTSWASPNWLESAVLARSGQTWLMDRAASIRVQAVTQP